MRRHHIDPSTVDLAELVQLARDEHRQFIRDRKEGRPTLGKVNASLYLALARYLNGTLLGPDALGPLPR